MSCRWGKSSSDQKENCDECLACSSTVLVILQLVASVMNIPRKHRPPLTARQRAQIVEYLTLWQSCIQGNKLTQKEKLKAVLDEMSEQMTKAVDGEPLLVDKSKILRVTDAKGWVVTKSAPVVTTCCQALLAAALQCDGTSLCACCTKRSCNIYTRALLVLCQCFQPSGMVLPALAACEVSTFASQRCMLHLLPFQ